MQRLLIFIVPLFFSVWGAFPDRIEGHPHNWIALNSEFILDRDQRLVEIRQRWEFDALYSAITLDNMRREYGDEKRGLVGFAEKFVTNLKYYNYFTQFNIDGTSIDLPKPGSYQLKRIIRNDQSVLELEMHFRMENPLTLQDQILSWSVYDPTYYIAMAHYDVNDVVIRGDTASQCKKDLIESTPSNDMIQYAQSLDRNQKNTEGLGINFAQQVRINCFQES